MDMRIECIRIPILEIIALSDLVFFGCSFRQVETYFSICL